jgi:hypothetical protein
MWTVGSSKWIRVSQPLKANELLSGDYAMNVFLNALELHVLALFTFEVVEQSRQRNKLLRAFEVWAVINLLFVDR